MFKVLPVKSQGKILFSLGDHLLQLVCRDDPPGKPMWLDADHVEACVADHVEACILRPHMGCRIKILALLHWELWHN